MLMRTSLAFALLSALAACASLEDSADASVSQTEQAVTDAIGLPRERPGEIVIDEGQATVPTPYGGQGAARSCEAVATDIVRLTALLGPDREVPRPGAETGEGEDGPLDLSMEEAGEAAVEGAQDAYRSTIVGLNPARPVIRFLGQAGEIEAAARRERELALKRRAYLRGVFDAEACPRAVLEAALDQYQLTAP